MRISDWSSDVCSSDRTLWRATADTQCSILRNAGGRRRAPRARVVAALVLQRGRHERRQRQRRMMGVGAVVKRFELLGALIDLAAVEVATHIRQRETGSAPVREREVQCM